MPACFSMPGLWEDSTTWSWNTFEGQTLTAVLKQGRLPLCLLLKYGLQIPDALTAAHDTGLLHRNLRPANVMITPEGRVKVLDLVIAKRLYQTGTADTRTTGLTETGRALTTSSDHKPAQVLQHRRQRKPMSTSKKILSIWSRSDLSGASEMLGMPLAHDGGFPEVRPAYLFSHWMMLEQRNCCHGFSANYETAGELWRCPIERHPLFWPARMNYGDVSQFKRIIESVAPGSSVRK